jgi:rod shape-determining protein MreC
MIRFLELLVRFKEYAVLCVFIALSFLLMTFGNAAKLRGFRIVVISGIGTLQSTLAWIPNPITVASENAALRTMNYRLTREIAQTRRAVSENQKLRSLLQFRDSSEYGVRPAEIVGRIMDKSRYYLTLNAGVLDSIYTGMPIMNDVGLVGFVYSASAHHSIVQSLLDKDTRIAAKVQRTRTNGIIAWEGGSTLYLTNVAKAEDVKVGDVVVTSDYSSRYPADIPIGRVIERLDEPTTLFWKLRIQPMVHFPSLEYVFVGLQQPDAERLMVQDLLERRLRKSDGSSIGSGVQRDATPRPRAVPIRPQRDTSARERRDSTVQDSLNQ